MMRTIVVGIHDYLLSRIEKDEAILAYRETQLQNMSKDQVSDHNKRKAKLKAEKEKLLIVKRKKKGDNG